MTDDLDPVDVNEVSERLYRSEKEVPCKKIDEKEIRMDKECTFKPVINANSRVLSRLLR